MNPPSLDPIVQTAAVGVAICAISSLCMYYLWRGNRQDRSLKYWMVGWMLATLRWVLHPAGTTHLSVRFVEGLMATAFALLMVLGSYDIVPDKPCKPGTLGWPLAALFLALDITGAALDLVYPLTYAAILLAMLAAACCFWRAYRASDMGAYAIVAITLLAEAATLSGGLLLWGAALPNAMVIPVLNLPVTMSLLLLAYDRSQRRARDAQQSLRKIFDTAPIPLIIAKAPSGETMFFNEAGLDLARVSANELLGKTAAQLGIVSDPETRKAIYDALDRGERVVQREIQYLRGGKETRTFAMSASVLELDNGKHYTFALFDLTDLRRAQADLEHLNVTLEEQVADRTRDLEAFGASVSHDLRAPLRHIGGFLDVLEESLGDRLDGESRKIIDTVNDSVRHMGALIDDLLRFSRLGSAALSKEPCDLCAMVNKVIGTLRGETTGRDIAWRIGGLPVVEADARLLHQVLVNLLSNAVKYTGTCAQAIIEIDCLAPGSDSGERVFFVRDNGVGFDSKYAGKLFGVFQRLHPANEFEGHGIGLAIVNNIVRKHGGRVWADGAVGRGATFYFTLTR